MNKILIKCVVCICYLNSINAGYCSTLCVVTNTTAEQDIKNISQKSLQALVEDNRKALKEFNTIKAQVINPILQSDTNTPDKFEENELFRRIMIKIEYNRYKKSENIEGNEKLKRWMASGVSTSYYKFNFATPSLYWDFVREEHKPKGNEVSPVNTFRSIGANLCKGLRYYVMLMHKYGNTLCDASGKIYDFVLDDLKLYISSRLNKSDDKKSNDIAITNGIRSFALIMQTLLKNIDSNVKVGIDELVNDNDAEAIKKLKQNKQPNKALASSQQIEWFHEMCGLKNVINNIIDEFHKLLLGDKRPGNPRKQEDRIAELMYDTYSKLPSDKDLLTQLGINTQTVLSRADDKRFTTASTAVDDRPVNSTDNHRLFNSRVPSGTINNSSTKSNMPTQIGAVNTDSSQISTSITSNGKKEKTPIRNKSKKNGKVYHMKDKYTNKRVQQQFDKNREIYENVLSSANAYMAKLWQNWIQDKNMAVPIPRFDYMRYGFQQFFKDEEINNVDFMTWLMKHYINNYKSETIEKLTCEFSCSKQLEILSSSLYDIIRQYMNGQGTKQTGKDKVIINEYVVVSNSRTKPLDNKILNNKYKYNYDMLSLSGTNNRLDENGGFSKHVFSIEVYDKESSRYKCLFFVNQEIPDINKETHIQTYLQYCKKYNYRIGEIIFPTTEFKTFAEKIKSKLEVELNDRKDFVEDLEDGFSNEILEMIDDETDKNYSVAMKVRALVNKYYKKFLENNEKYSDALKKKVEIDPLINQAKWEFPSSEEYKMFENDMNIKVFSKFLKDEHNITNMLILSDSILNSYCEKMQNDETWTKELDSEKKKHYGEYFEKFIKNRKKYSEAYKKKVEIDPLIKQLDIVFRSSKEYKELQKEISPLKRKNPDIKLKEDFLNGNDDSKALDYNKELGFNDGLSPANNTGADLNNTPPNFGDISMIGTY